MKLLCDIKNLQLVGNYKKDANVLSIQLQVKAMELNSFIYVKCVCVCLLNQLWCKIKAAPYFYVLILNLCQPQPPQIINPGSQMQTLKLHISHSKKR